MSRKPSAPGHLSPRARTFWRKIASEYVLESHQLELLRRVCEAMDTADQARSLLAAEGLTTSDRYDQLKAHPAVNIERDARLAIARLLRELNLAAEEPADSRPATLVYSAGKRR